MLCKLIVLSCSLPHAFRGFAQYSFTMCDILKGLAYLGRVFISQVSPSSVHTLILHYVTTLRFQNQAFVTQETPEQRLLPHLSFEQMYLMTPKHLLLFSPVHTLHPMTRRFLLS